MQITKVISYIYSGEVWHMLEIDGSMEIGVSPLACARCLASGVPYEERYGKPESEVAEKFAAKDEQG